MNEQEFLNAYIENMAKKLGDQVKSEVLLSTQLEIAVKRNQLLETEIQKLRSDLEKLNKKNKKEVDTSATF